MTEEKLKDLIARAAVAIGGILIWLGGVQVSLDASVPALVRGFGTVTILIGAVVFGASLVRSRSRL